MGPNSQNKNTEPEHDIMVNYGRKDGSQTGRKSGGQGRNQTTTCRHQTIKKSR